MIRATGRGAWTLLLGSVVLGMMACGPESGDDRVSVRLGTSKPVGRPSSGVGTFALCTKAPVIGVNQPVLGGVALVDRFQNAPEVWPFQKYSLSSTLVDWVPGGETPLSLVQTFDLRKGGPRTLEVSGFAEDCVPGTVGDGGGGTLDVPRFHPVLGKLSGVNLEKPGDVVLDTLVSKEVLSVPPANGTPSIPTAPLLRLKLPAIPTAWTGLAPRAKLQVFAGEGRVYGYVIPEATSLLNTPFYLGPLFAGQVYLLKVSPLSSALIPVTTVSSKCLKLDLLKETGGKILDLSSIPAPAWSDCL